MRGVYEKVKGSKDFYIRYTDENGLRHREHVGREAAAVEALVNRRREIREGRFIAPSRPTNLTFKELFEKRLAHLELKPKTLRHLKSAFACKRLDDLKDMPARKITSENVAAVLKSLRKDNGRRKGGRSDGTIRNYRATISAVFAYGVEHGYLKANPARKTAQPAAPRDRVRFLAKDEEESIRQRIRELFPEREAELDLLLHSGLRSGEAYLLTWDRVDLERGVIDVPLSGKTGWRQVPVNSVCRQAIEALHAQSGGSQFVIPRCGPWKDDWTPGSNQNWKLGDWLRKAAGKAGILNVSPHTLRHTFASRLVMAGVDLRQVQQFLGHSSIVMTMRYAHLSPEHGKAAIEKLCAPTTSAPKPAVRVMAAAAGE